MREIAPGIHVLERPLRFLGLEIGARMTVLRLADGLLVHSPIDVAPEPLKELGEPRWVLAPNKFHHMFVGPWVDAGLEGWAAPGVAEKRRDVPFTGVLESGVHPFGPDIEVMTLSCFPFSNEAVLFHKPSRTLLVTDLVFNFPRTAPWLIRAVMRCMCGYPGCQTSLFERVGMNRSIARKEIATILDFGFERIVMSHGDVVERDAREAFAYAYRWLGVG